MSRGQLVRDAVPDWQTYADREGIALVGRGRWRTTGCPFHGGTDSMRVNTESGGWVCMSCGCKGGDVLAYHIQWHGLDFVDAARALGAWQEGESSGVRHRPRTLSAHDALQLLYRDALLTWVAAQTLSQGTPLLKEDLDALTAAARRILLLSEERHL